MEWKDVAEVLFLAGWSAIGLWVARCIEKMQASVEKLNVNVAVIVTKVEGHERRLEKLENDS